MDYTELVTVEAFEMLRCHSCKNYLSYSPICISGDTKNICGRCHTLCEDSSAKNEAYEVLAQFIKFPCRYKDEGCRETAFPTNIPNHEKVCDFRIVSCPANHFTGCPWTGAKPNALSHCLDRHCDVILKEGEFQFDLTKTFQEQSLIEHNSSIYIVKYNFYSINKLMEFSLFKPEWEINFTEFAYPLIFKTEKRNVTIQSKATTFDKKYVEKIYLDSLKEHENDLCAVRGKVNLQNSPVSEELCTVDKKINEQQLSLFRCVRCNEYALPPIYCEENGVNIVCLNCNNAASKTGVTLNIPRLIQKLSEVANQLYYPCPCSKSGCTFVSLPNQMKAHISICLYSNQFCPLNDYVSCKWEGTGKNIVEHILEIHENMLLKSSEVTEKLPKSQTQSSTKSVFGTSTFGFGSNSCGTLTPPKFNFSSQTQPNYVNSTNFEGLFGKSKPNQSSVDNGVVHCAPTPVDPSLNSYIIKFGDQLFLMNFGKTQYNYYWTVQMIRLSEEKFMFELEIIDRNGQGGSLIFRQPCIALSSKNQLPTQNCAVYDSQVAKLIKDGKITFRIRIYK